MLNILFYHSLTADFYKTSSCQPYLLKLMTVSYGISHLPHKILAQEVSVYVLRDCKEIVTGQKKSLSVSHQIFAFVSCPIYVCCGLLLEVLRFFAILNLCCAVNHRLRS